ncbi:MAG: hypothetical protein IPM45_01135 [Acidimicrobiales bacterium]|nr:hypothetical protein [Acidimicrobiales bacterium]
MRDTEPRDLHEWVSFDDPHEARTWVFDLTFLASSWTCVFGAGCPGVLTGPAPELEHGCCSYGAHFTDDADHDRVAAAAATLTPDLWQLQHVARRRDGFARRRKDGSWRTRLVDDACIFLNRPGFPGGAGCALHRAALERGLPPLDLKPDVCWQLPLRRVDSVDELGHVTSTIREWKRRDWGEGGDHFHWWCTDAPDAFVGHHPVYVTMRDELVAMVGDEVYALLAGHLGPRSRRARLLPHPATRG